MFIGLKLKVSDHAHVEKIHSWKPEKEFSTKFLENPDEKDPNDDDMLDKEFILTRDWKTTMRDIHSEDSGSPVQIKKSKK